MVLTLDVMDGYFTIFGDIAGLIEVSFEGEAVVDPFFEFCERMDVGVRRGGWSHQVQQI